MKSYIYPALLVCSLILFSCAETLCDTLINNAESARNNYQSNPNNTNCVNYQASILSLFADSNCIERNGINYRSIFQAELDSLDCTTTCNNGVQDGDETGIDCGGVICPACTGPSTCSNGMQDGNETGVDCGGSCPPCGSMNPTVFFNGVIDGNSVSVQVSGSIGTGFNQGDCIANGLSDQVMGFTDINLSITQPVVELTFFLNYDANTEGRPELNNQFVINSPYNFVNCGSSSIGVVFEYYDGTTVWKTELGSQTGNSLTITDKMYFPDVLQSIETNFVQCEFNCTLYDGNGNSISLINGEFDGFIGLP